MILLKKKFATPHFKWTELECKCKRSCGVGEGKKARWIQPEALQKLENLREFLGVPMHINSSCRCPLHNASVGGAPLSTHRSSSDRPSRAFDLRIVVPKVDLIQAAADVGFQGIGINYNSFVHVDNRPRRARW